MFFLMLLLVRVIKTILHSIICPCLSLTYWLLSPLLPYFKVTRAIICVPCAFCMRFVRKVLFYPCSLLSSLLSFYFEETEAIVCFPCSVCMNFTRTVLFYIYLFFSHLLFIFTSPYVPLPTWFPSLSIPVLDLRGVPSRIRPYTSTVCSFLSRFNPFSRSPSITPPPPANQDSQGTSSGHSSPPTMKRKGKGRGKKRSKTHQKFSPSTESSWTRGGDGRDLEQGILEEEEEKQQRRGYGGRGGRGGSQIAGGGSLKYEEERGGGGREGRGRGGSQIAGGGSLKYEEERRGGGGRGGGGSQIAGGGSLKYEEERRGRGGRGRGGESQRAGRGNLKDDEQRGGRGRGKRTSGYEMTDEVATKTKRGRQVEDVEERRSGGRGQEERTKDLPPYPRGLPNLGQTCYMNGVLQSLYHLEPLAEVFRELQGSRNHGEVVLATMDLWAALRDGGDLQGKVKHMKRVAAERDDNFRGYAQKEAHDFLAQLLDWLHTDLADEIGAAQEHNGDVGAEPGSGRVESPISRLFRTTQLNSVRCNSTGKNLTEVEEAALNLSLPVTREGPTNLKEVFEKSLRPQTMLWDCDKCEETHDCESRSDITKLPGVLVLHLSRVSEAANSHRKLRVSYPATGLQLGATTGGARRSYSLAAVCCHDGGMDGGHYTAFCRVNARWFSFNDTFVRHAEYKEVLDRPSAHILFYEAEDMSS